jgi:hypothetical protein
MRTLLALPYLTISLHEGPNPVLELQWLSYAVSAELRAGLVQAVQFSLQHHVKGWVSDDRLQGAVRPRDVEWAEHDILLPLDKAGLERFAQLESHNALNRLTIDVAYTRTMPTLHFAVQRFEDIDQARAWASGRT